VDPADWAAAEHDLVASAVGGFTADQTRVQATVWKLALDPDGVEGDAEEAMRDRALTRLGTRDGLVRYRMGLVPEISGKLEQALAAVVSPRSKPVFLDGEEPGEDATVDRSSPQKRYDAFAALIDAAARSAQVASMGGAAPTVLVTVDGPHRFGGPVYLPRSSAPALGSDVSAFGENPRRLATEQSEIHPEAHSLTQLD
jgi:hypothetical protein